AMDAQVYARLRDFHHVDPDRLIGWDIEDPFLQGIEVFRECAGDIEGCMEGIREIMTERMGRGV
ncbi:MAG: hypothetical protein ACE5GF_06310, partial [Thermodesulfobacteriota bacterium]